ncbi:unnamed protein product [Cuscuta campestris]|uniref:Uncharacterized protein n=1 Tax=Cuscuta campestris TaxID=132261 RepID=A0A484KZN9_9ASTE|nr:unnamed protein product [Cuscuta campestris]
MKKYQEDTSAESSSKYDVNDVLRTLDPTSCESVLEASHSKSVSKLTALSKSSTAEEAETKCLPTPSKLMPESMLESSLSRASIDFSTGAMGIESESTPYDSRGIEALEPTPFDSFQLPNSEVMEMHHVSEQKLAGKVNIEHYFYRTLSSWLRENYEKSKKWTNESWNTEASKVRNKMHDVPDFNAARPTRECRAVIQAIMKSVFDYHDSVGCHGNVLCTDSYLLTIKEGFFYGAATLDCRAHPFAS